MPDPHRPVSSPITLENVTKWLVGEASAIVNNEIERDLASKDSLVKEYIDWMSGASDMPRPRLLQQHMAQLSNAEFEAFTHVDIDTEQYPFKILPESTAGNPSAKTQSSTKKASLRILPESVVESGADLKHDAEQRGK